MKLSFCGGAKEVTGANYLLESGDAKILIDCGLFQGEDNEQGKNNQEFPYNPKSITALCITHAHVDHIGRLPFLYKRGFKGKTYATPPTKDLLLLALHDTQRLLEEEARENGYPPPYTKEDVSLVEHQIETQEYKKAFSSGPFSVRFFTAGHILGSCSIEIKAEGKTIIFSGDLGNPASPFLDPPAVFGEADYVVMESVYGDRLHIKTVPRKDALENVIEDNAKRGGALMIPAFALERTQEILYDLDSLVSEGRVPSLPVFVDSPLAIAATKVYQRYPDYYKEEVRQKIKENGDLFSCPCLTFTENVEESKRINDIPLPKIIVAGSGMSQGGRILHHERRYLKDAKSTILFVGYQAKGSRGRKIFERAKYVRIFGEEIHVRSRISSIDGYSAHADQEDLVNWARPFKDVVKKVFLVQGEEEAAKALSFQLKDFLGIEVIIPSNGESVLLE